MSEQVRPGLNEDLESEQSRSLSEEPLEAPDQRDRLEKLIESQNKAILQLTEKLSEMSTGLNDVKDHQDQSDAAIIEVAKKVGGGGGGKGDLLAQLIPLLRQNPGPSPLEKVAMQSFMRNIAFASLTTERLAKKQFGDEYTKMVKDMETDLSGTKKPKGT